MKTEHKDIKIQYVGTGWMISAENEYLNKEPLSPEELVKEVNKRGYTVLNSNSIMPHYSSKFQHQNRELNHLISTQSQPEAPAKNIIDELRRLITGDQSFDRLLNRARDLGHLELMLEGEHASIRCITFNRNRSDEIECCNDLNPDEAIFQVTFNQHATIANRKLAIATIMLADCTGCCNAIETLSMGPKGILAHAKIGRTIHD